MGARRLSEKKSHTHVHVLVAGEGEFVDLVAAMQLLRQLWGIERLLCEGGPTLYGYMSRAGLIDEKFLTISPVEIGLFVPGNRNLPIRKNRIHRKSGLLPSWRLVF